MFGQGVPLDANGSDNSHLHLTIRGSSAEICESFKAGMPVKHLGTENCI